MVPSESKELKKWASKLPANVLVNLYNAYVRGPRTRLFIETDIESVKSFSEMSRSTSQFVKHFRAATEDELLELYFIRAFLIACRLLWIIDGEKLEQVANLLVEHTFQQIFSTPPFTEENLIFFIEEFEAKVQYADGGEFFKAELEKVEKLYFEIYHVERADHVVDYVNFMELFISQYERDVRQLQQQQAATPAYAFYLMLLLICKLHLFAGVIEPDAVAK